MVTKSIERAQEKVEHMNFDHRKHLLEYDDVMNQQRKTIYALRKQVLEGIYEVDESPSPDAPADAQVRTLPQAEIDRFLERIRPTVEMMVKVFGTLPTPAEGEKQAEPQESNIQDLKSVRTAELEREVYRYFGVRVPLDGTEEKPAEAFERILAEVPKSLVQQRERLLDLSDQFAGDLVDKNYAENRPIQECIADIADEVQKIFDIKLEGLKGVQKPEDIHKNVYDRIEARHRERENEIPPELLLWAFRDFYLRETDKQWIDHLQNMDALRQAIGLRGYGNKDPKQEYKREGYEMFVEMIDSIQRNVLQRTFKVQLEKGTDIGRVRPRKQRQTVEGRGEARQRRTVKRDQPKVGRNDPCPCGSGKKYKKCCMSKELSA